MEFVKFASELKICCCIFFVWKRRRRRSGRRKKASGRKSRERSARRVEDIIDKASVRRRRLPDGKDAVYAADGTLALESLRGVELTLAMARHY